MKLYDNRNNTYKVSCGYCRHEGHNKRHCPTLRRHWRANKDWDGASLSTLTDIQGSDFAGYWSVSNSDAKFQFRYHFDYINKIMTSTPTAPKKRRASKCGFCGSKAHTRRKCSLMGKFVKILEETNRAYRKAFYETVFVEQGIGVGAFVEFKRYTWNYNEEPNPTSLIMDIDFDSISIGNYFNRWSQWSKVLDVRLRHDDREFAFGTQFLLDASYPLLDRKRLSHLSSHYEGITKVIVPAPSLPDKEWFLGQSPAFDWVVKKKSFRDLLSAYGGAIRTYHPDGQAIWEKLRKKL